MILAMKRLLSEVAIAIAMLGFACAQQDSLSQKSITGPPQAAKPKPDVKPPKAIKITDPKPARHPGKGMTLISATVGIDGWAHDAKVIESSGSEESDDSALAAIQKWRFKPATVDGHPVAVQISIKMDARRQ
jgi:TonB family protein